MTSRNVSRYTPRSGSGWPIEQVGEETSQEEACSHRSCHEVQQSSHCRPVESSRPSQGRGVIPSDKTAMACLSCRLRDTVASERSLFARKARKSREDK